MTTKSMVSKLMKHYNVLNNSFIITMNDVFHMIIKQFFWLFICLILIFPNFANSNEKVLEAQKILTEMGYEVLNNGKLDDLTEIAINKFYNDLGLEFDGVLDDNEVENLKNAKISGFNPNNLKINSTLSVENIKEVQNLLFQMGYKIKETNKIDEMTQKAISNFYSDLGLKYDGSLNDEKINQIRNAMLSGFKSSEIDIEFSQKKIQTANPNKVSLCQNYEAIPKQNKKSFVSKINSTTSRFIRTETMCRIATEDCLKPELQEWDNVMISDSLYAFADLNDDNIPELIAGAFDETFLHNNPRFAPGNKERALKKHQYSFYSSDPNFQTPKGTKFIVARHILVNDFNNDGKDDLFFIQYGPDVQGRGALQKNEVMLSSESGYKVKYAPGKKSRWHGGAAGDIDNDGDIDVIASPVVNYELGKWTDIALYENIGSGNFKYKKLFNNVGKFHFLELWDVDNDGHLDILMDGGNEKADLKISWGKSKGRFSKPEVLLKTPNSVAEAIEFVDIDNDGNLELILLSSLNTGINKERYNYDMYFGGFEIAVLKINKREFLSKKVITRHIHPKGHHSWLARISACDIKKDGNIDLVFEKIGEGNYFTDLTDQPFYDWSKTDKVVWFNDGKGNFEIIRFEDPMYFKDDERFRYKENKEYIKRLLKHADEYGISLKKYIPNKTYYKREDGKLFIMNQRNMQPYTFIPLELE